MVFGVSMRLGLNLSTLLLYGLLLAVLSWQVAAPFWAYIVLGLLIVVLAFPVHVWLRERIQRPRIAAALTVIGVVAVVIVPLSFLAWRIVSDMIALVSGLSVNQVVEMLQTLLLWTNETFGYPRDVDPSAAREMLNDFLPSMRSRLAAWAPAAVSSAGTFLLGIIVTIIVAYYGLINGETFLDRLKDASPMDDGLEEKFLHEAGETVNGVIWGQIVTAGLQGALIWVAFFVTGLPNAFFWSFVAAVLSFLPVIGAFFVWAPAGIFLLASGDTAAGVGLLIWGAAVISSVDNIVKPMIIGRSGAMHPLLAFIGVLGGLAAFGIMGFLMGPLILSLLASVFSILADTGWDLEKWQNMEKEPSEPSEEEVEPPPEESEGAPAAG